ncbi:replication stress response regulator SDE2 isoform X2 [Belonocnema kinseyi]|uniref:replication stress response regulator SDE2 isoform X2 n=1 Tax=Belonocnema kinseyi TaxID=2817044 RepID=UPI00143CFE5B|nr:replication stress response regulator SDE2 isoform X2 [Belonocnema kinseyi]
MLTVNVNTGVSIKSLFTSEIPLTVSQIWDEIQDTTTISRENFYILYNGRLASDFDTLSAGFANITPRIFGGKGGFGSMLRAIGAQIEKTTNREACRDLSGRRLRDINEEKRLKLWIEKQSERKEEAAERKKKRLEKLRSEPRHEFKDSKYDEERSVMTERVADSVKEGFKERKRIAETEEKVVKKKKVTLGYGFDIDSDDSESSENGADDSESSKVDSDKKSKVAACKKDSNDENSLEKLEIIDNSEGPSGSGMSLENISDNSDSKKNFVDETSVEEKNDSDVTPVEKLKVAEMQRPGSP